MECIRCGRCCREAIIEVCELDLIREPRLKPHIDPFKHRSGEYMLKTPCPFLEGDKCSIYPTRPSVCVGFEPGSQPICSLYRTIIVGNEKEK